MGTFITLTGRRGPRWAPVNDVAKGLVNGKFINFKMVNYEDVLRLLVLNPFMDATPSGPPVVRMVINV